MKRPLLAAALLLFTCPGLAQGIGEKTGINARVGKSSSTADFVKIAAISQQDGDGSDNGRFTFAWLGA